MVIGIPFLVLFFGSVRVLSLVEGRIVEAMLGERMPRRPVYGSRDKPLLQRIGDMFLDPRSWSTMLYMLLMLPLGIAYFTVAVTGLSVSLACMAAPVMLALGYDQYVSLDFGGAAVGPLPWAWPLVFLGGVLLLFATLHVARGVAHLHGQLAKHLLVKAAPPAPSPVPATPATASSASPAG